MKKLLFFLSNHSYCQIINISLKEVDMFLSKVAKYETININKIKIARKINQTFFSDNLNVHTSSFGSSKNFLHYFVK